MEGGMGDGMDMAPPPSSRMPGMAHKGGGMMHMTFFWGKRVQILFSGWPADRGLGMYLLSLFFVFVIATLIECLSFASRRLVRPTSTYDRRVSTAFLLTALHALQMGMAYLLMLAVMSFNVGVLIAAVAGHALGFVISGSGLLKWSQASGGSQPNSDTLPSTNKC